MMKQFIQSIACMFVLVGALSGYGAVIAAWDFNESDTSGDGNTTTANGWTAFRIGNGATDTVNFTDTDGHTTSNSITLTQGSDAGWTDRDRILIQPEMTYWQPSRRWLLQPTTSWQMVLI